MTGTMVVEGGGFVSLRSDNSLGRHVHGGLGLSGFAGLIVDCMNGESASHRGSTTDYARVYRVLLRTSASSASGVSWSATFCPGSNRGRHRLPFSKFMPRRRGKRAEGFPGLSADVLRELSSLSLLLARSDNPDFSGGKFYVRLFSIDGYRSRRIM